MASIIVRRLEREDLQTRVAWLNQQSVYRQMTFDIPLSLADTEEWFSRNRLNRSRADFCFFIRDDENEVTRAAMGGLVDISQYHRRAEMYIVVNPGMTGCGIGQKTVQWLCNYGFSELNLMRIYLFTLPDNTRAQRLYELSGFVREGVLRQHVYHRNKLRDRYVYGILREEWLQQAWRGDGVLVLEVLI